MLREQAERALRESEARYRGTFENAAVGVAHIGLDGAYLRVNQKLQEITGYSADELQNMTFQQITPQHYLRADFEGIHSLNSGEIKAYSVEKQIIRKGGDALWISVTRSLAYRQDGSPDYFIAVVVDISLRKELEETLRQANATLEMRVRERTAELEVLTASLRLLAAKLTQTEQSERRRLAELIHDDLQQLLVAARIQVNAARAAAREEGLLDSRDLAISLLDQAIEEARSLTAQLRPPALYESGLIAALGWLCGWMKQAYAFDVELTVSKGAEHLPEEGAAVLFDSVREMLLNAVKHSGADRASLSVSEHDGGWLVVRVSDQGRGFDVSVLDQPPGDDGKFGLFSVRERVAAIGGRLEVNSLPGAGATFELFWPRTTSGDVVTSAFERPGQGPAGSTRPRDAEAPAEQISVILVDDHALVRQSIAGLLRREADIDVVGEASDGEEAVEVVATHHPQVVVMDVNLPKLNGVQATRIIKSREPGIVVIGMSVHNDAATRQAMLDAGASSYVTKDRPLETLVETIRRQARVVRERSG
jgi:PAS domain S-box-containing protein